MDGNPARLGRAVRRRHVEATVVTEINAVGYLRIPRHRVVVGMDVCSLNGERVSSVEGLTQEEAAGKDVQRVQGDRPRGVRTTSHSLIAIESGQHHPVKH